MCGFYLKKIKYVIGRAVFALERWCPWWYSLMERKFVVNSRSKFLIFMVLGAMFAAGAARAVDECYATRQVCSDGKYNKYGCQIGGLMPITGYSCVSCPAPFNKSGTSLPQTINDCNIELNCGESECNIYYDGRVNCNGGTGDYHLEVINSVATCIENTRACSVFDIDVAYGAWTCSKNSQTGSAQWTPSEDAWDTSGCGCNVVNKDIDMDIANTVVKCKKANAVYYVTDANKYATKKVSDYVHYSTERQWCAQCYPGYLPTTTNSPDSYGIYFRPNNNGNWGVASCATQVTVPDYAPGCTINFGLATGDDVMADCRGICPTGFETEANGATSISDCVSQYTETYEDSTGTFVLTSLDSCP